MSKSPFQTIPSCCPRGPSLAARTSLAILCLILGYKANAAATLSWEDNSDNEDGFVIERSLDGETFTRLATVAANATRYVDSSTRGDDLYHYRVAAFNAFGYSGYTNIALHDPVPKIAFDDWMSQLLAGGFSSDSRLAPDGYLKTPDLPNFVCYLHGINPFDPDYRLLPHCSRQQVRGSARSVIELPVARAAKRAPLHLLASKDLVHWERIPYKAATFRKNKTHRWLRITLPAESAGLFFRLEYKLPAVTTN